MTQNAFLASTAFSNIAVGSTTVSAVYVGSTKIWEAASGVTWTDPDIANASYDSVSFDISSQSSVSIDIFFKPDGTKFYILDLTADTLFQYSLSTAWDVSTASYNSVSYALPTDITIPSGMFFNSDGTKYYIPCRGSDYIYELALSTAYDISTSSYNSVRINVATVDNTPESVYFSPSGDKMFFVGAGNDNVYRYSLSTNYDLSTASYDNVSFSVSTQEAVPVGISFKSDGSKMYIVGLDSDAIYQYST